MTNPSSEVSLTPLGVLLEEVQTPLCFKADPLMIFTVDHRLENGTGPVSTDPGDGVGCRHPALEVAVIGENLLEDCERLDVSHSSLN